MKYLFIILLLVFFISCKQENNYVENSLIALDDYWRKVTGYDSIQLVYGGRGKYNESKHKYDVTWDSLYANFCYPNKWQFQKFKNDTIFSTAPLFNTIDVGYSDTIYLGDSTPFVIASWYKPKKKKRHNVKAQTKTVKIDYCDTCEVLYMSEGKLYLVKDSTYLYWKKYNYFKKELSATVDMMNEPFYPAFDEKIFRLEDSCRKYKLLLDGKRKN